MAPRGRCYEGDVCAGESAFGGGLCRSCHLAFLRLWRTPLHGKAMCYTDKDT